MKTCRHLVFVLGDQLDENSAAFADFDLSQDRVFMAEVREESTHVWSTKPRTAFFFAAMRHFSALLQTRKIAVDYQRIGSHGFVSLIAALADAITREAIADVNKHFADHPGTLVEFAWPVTRKDALRALKSFTGERLKHFGEYQDAMWANEPFLYHAHISAALNVKLLHPREVINAALTALNEGIAPIEAVEGFVRQVLGWREFIRGIYWLEMPGMRQANHFRHERNLPAWYWTADTHMNCMRQTITQTLEHGYAHHIQRLMVKGIFGLLAETRPQELEDWYLAVYVDAVEWVELPNVAGMALFANNGRFTLSMKKC